MAMNGLKKQHLTGIYRSLLAFTAVVVISCIGYFYIVTRQVSDYYKVGRQQQVAEDQLIKAVSQWRAADFKDEAELRARLNTVFNDFSMHNQRISPAQVTSVERDGTGFKVQVNDEVLELR